MGSLSLGLPKLVPQTKPNQRGDNCLRPALLLLRVSVPSVPAGRRRLFVEAFGGGGISNEPVVIFV